MVRISTFICLLLVGKLAFSQGDAIAKEAAFGFIDSVFQSSTATYEINELRPSDSLLAIMIKFNNAIAANKDWAAEYMNKYYVPGEGAPYNEKFGITKAEYEMIKKSDASSYKLNKVKSEKLIITKADSCISFEGNDSFRVMNYLIFCGHSKTVTFGKDTVFFAGEITAPSSAPYGQWHGYRWHYEKSDQKSEGDINIHQLSAKIIEVDIGRTIPGNRILLRIEFQQIEKGEKKAYMDLMGFIN
jgi:hypothetical protein